MLKIYVLTETMYPSVDFKQSICYRFNYIYEYTNEILKDVTCVASNIYTPKCKNTL